MVRIYGLEIMRFLYSGCSTTTTVVGKYRWNVLEDRCRKQDSTVKSCTIANGMTCDVLGSITIHIKLREKIQLLEF